jgi:hypothetical protein
LKVVKVEVVHLSFGRVSGNVAARAEHMIQLDKRLMAHRLAIFGYTLLHSSIGMHAQMTQSEVQLLSSIRDGRKESSSRPRSNVVAQPARAIDTALLLQIS